MWCLGTLFTAACQKSAEGCDARQTTVRASSVVVGDPSWQSLGPDAGVGVGRRVGPLAQERLDEALGLAVRTRPVRAGAAVADAELRAGLCEEASEVTEAVVCEDAAHAD